MDFILSAIPYFMYWGSTMFILASASPRRRALLRQIGARFVSVPSGATEELKEYVPNDTVLRNALLKARTVAAEYPEHAVLGADTAVVYVVWKAQGCSRCATYAQRPCRP